MRIKDHDFVHDIIITDEGYVHDHYIIDRHYGHLKLATVMFKLSLHEVVQHSH